MSPPFGVGLNQKLLAPLLFRARSGRHRHRLRRLRLKALSSALSLVVRAIRVFLVRGTSVVVTVLAVFARWCATSTSVSELSCSLFYKESVLHVRCFALSQLGFVATIVVSLSVSSNAFSFSFLCTILHFY